MRHTSFDTLKGFLIIVVAVGHLLPGSLDQNPARQLIYFFHMPLFIAVTGYFIKHDLLLHPPLSIVKKYFRRLLTPYIPAFLVYSSMVWLHAYRMGDLAPETIIASIINPYYHLWYIPAVILFVFYTKGLATMRGNTLLFFGLGFAFMVTVLAGIYADVIDDTAWLKAIGDSRYYYYYYYFLFGYLLSRHQLGPKVMRHMRYWAFLLTLLILVYQIEYLRPFDTVLINSVLILLAISICERRKMFNIKWLSAVGKVSLPIYLWHVLPLVIIRNVFPDGGLSYYMAAGMSIYLLIVTLVAFENTGIFLNRYLYGISFSGR